VGFSSQPGNDFRTYSGTIRLRVALTPVSALFSEYVYYYYDLGSNVTTVPGVPPTLDRNSVRLGLTLWLPLVRR
jgi:hypothetical protein